MNINDCHGHASTSAWGDLSGLGTNGSRGHK